MIIYDRTVGTVLHILNTIAVLYYVVWILVTPFVDTSHFSQSWFPPREFGLVIPAFAVVAFFGTALTVTAHHLRKASMVKASPAASHSFSSYKTA